MATSERTLTELNDDLISNVSEMKIGIVVSEWNPKITNGLLKGAKECLKKYGLPEDQLFVHYVPGSFELPLGAQWLLNVHQTDAVICLGCVIQGETKHFDFVCQGLTKGIMELSLKSNKPILFGVLTDQDIQQSIDRSGGKYGNKGEEAAISAIKMVALKKKLNQ